MKVKDYRMLIKKKPKYRARITRACPECWNELREGDGKKETWHYCYVCGMGYYANKFINFHSKDEQLRGTQLKALQEKGLIVGLERQVRFNLFPKLFCYRLSGDITHSRIRYDSKNNYPDLWHDFIFLDATDIKVYYKGSFDVKVLEQAKYYILDFKYFVGKEPPRVMVYEDFKGFQTKDSKKKIKLFEALYGVNVTITTRKDLKWPQLQSK